MAELVERALQVAELVERVLRSLQQDEKIISTKSFCKFISCGGTCGRPECEEKARNFEFVRSPPGKIYRSVNNGVTTGIPHRPDPAETVSKSETDSEAEPVDLIFFTSKDSEPPIIFDISSDNQESSGFGCSNVITSNDSKLPEIMEMSKDSRSSHSTWKTLRINADGPIASPSKQTATRQKAGLRTARLMRRIKKRGRAGGHPLYK